MTDLARQYADRLDAVEHADGCLWWHHQGGGKLDGSNVVCTCDRLLRQGELVRRMVEAVNDAHDRQLYPETVHGAALAVRPE